MQGRCCTGCQRTTAMTDFTSEMSIFLETVRAFSGLQPLPVLIDSLVTKRNAKKVTKRLAAVTAYHSLTEVRGRGRARSRSFWLAFAYGPAIDVGLIACVPVDPAKFTITEAGTAFLEAHPVCCADSDFCSKTDACLLRQVLSGQADAKSVCSITLLALKRTFLLLFLCL